MQAVELGLAPSAAEFIQLDVAVNQGNSGGPIVNLWGQVVGISNMSALTTNGISFAIPIDVAKAVIQQVGPGRPPKRASSAPASLQFCLGRVRVADMLLRPEWSWKLVHCKIEAGHTALIISKAMRRLSNQHQEMHVPCCSLRRLGACGDPTWA